MAVAGARMYVSGVELNRMGQYMQLGRYPIHWHMMGNAEGQYIVNSSIHDTYNRCVTIHGTDNVLVENNVTYDTVGHCFFLEDGIETGNQFIHNLGMLTKCHPVKPCVPTNLGPFGVVGGKKATATTSFYLAGQNAKDALIPSDNTAATFWITNPDNIYVDNVAAGSEATGFWIALPQHPVGTFLGTAASKATWPRQTPLGAFVGNVAHSNFDGFVFGRGPLPDQHFSPASHIARANPADPNSPMVETVIDDFTAYKNRNSGMWIRGEFDLFKNLKLADNGIGYTHASGNFGNSPFTSRVVDSLFVGETANIGNPGTPAEIAYGRSLPEPALPDFPIRGYEFYDYRHQLVNDTFVNFRDNATRKTGAISELLYTSYGMSSNNTVRGAKFINAKPVYFPPMEHKWANDWAGSGAYKTAVFHDLDGSVSGIPGAYILVNDQWNGIAIDKSCEIKPTWNAAVCKGDVGRLAVGGPGGGLRGLRGYGGAPGARRTRGAPAGRPGIFGRAPQPPVTVSRNGQEVTLNGATDIGAINIRAGTEIKVTTEMPTVTLRLSELNKGSWVIFEMPGFATAASGTPQDSLNALREARATSYYKGKGSLWVKVVSNGEGARIAGPYAGGTNVEVARVSSPHAGGTSVQQVSRR